jgi:hypothetical protein
VGAVNERSVEVGRGAGMGARSCVVEGARFADEGWPAGLVPRGRGETRGASGRGHGVWWTPTLCPYRVVKIIQKKKKRVPEFRVPVSDPNIRVFTG